MTPAASLLQPDSNPALYVSSVLTLYVDLPDTPLRASASDQWLARVGGGENGYQFGGREGARCGVTLWPALGAEIGKRLDCSLSQAGLSSPLTRGAR
jgi:hypothetical protein